MTILTVDDDDEDIEIFLEAIRDIDPSILCLVARSAEEALIFAYGAPAESKQEIIET